MHEFSSDVVVVGGGIAGMEAAASLADIGFSVALIDRSERLGGQAGSYACKATTSCAKCSACLIEDTISRVLENTHIRVLSNAEVEMASGEVGSFQVKLKLAQDKVEQETADKFSLLEPASLSAKAVILATGFDVFDAKGHGLLAYGQLPEVLTTRDLDDLLKEDDLDKFLPAANGANRVAFVQCVGSRDRKNGREYCSQICCKNSIRLANRLKHLNPDLDITIYYIDLQIMGKEFRTFHRDTSDKIRFLQGVPAEIRQGSEAGSVKLVGIDPDTGLGKEEEYNKVVLSVGMVGDSRNDGLIEQLGLRKNEFGFIATRLDTGMIATDVPGVYLAGACAGPSDIQNSRLQAMTAAKRIALDLQQKKSAPEPDVSMAEAGQAHTMAFANLKSTRRMMVLGSGFGARKTAANLVSAGFRVLLVEPPISADCVWPLSTDSEPEPADNEDIEILKDATLKSISGEVGDYHLVVDVDGERRAFDVGAMVIAVDDMLESHGKNQMLAGLISVHQFMEDQAIGKTQGDSIGLLLDANGPEGRGTAQAALSGALEHTKAGGSASIIFRNVPLYGKLGQKSYDEVLVSNVRFLRYDENRPEIDHSGDRIAVSMVDSVFPDKSHKFEIDRLIQAPEVKPGPGNPALAEMLRQPLDVEGYLQPGNIRHLPLSSPRKGVLFAGGCQQDYDSLESDYKSEAVISQLLNLLPEEDLSAPSQVLQVDEGKCVSCLTCLRLCPHGAIETSSGKKSVNIMSKACWECGICAAACPGQAIEHKGFPKAVMLETAHIDGDESARWKKTIVFACRQSAVPSLAAAGSLGLKVPENMTVLEVPCAGRVDETAIMHALEQGAERVLILGCHPDVCRSMKGNLLAMKRVDSVRAMLEESGIDAEMVQYHAIANNESYRLVKLLDGIISPAD